VFVSHDRYFIDKLATRVFEIGEGRIEVFPGNYEDYLWRKGKGDAAPDLSLRSNGDGAAVASSPPATSAEQKPAAVSPDGEAKPKRINPIKLKQMKERCQELEEEIVRLEAEVATAETALQSFVGVEETQRQTDVLKRARSELERSMSEWEELAAEVDAAEAATPDR